jgi:hypothetical protein
MQNALAWGCIAAGKNKIPAPSADARQKKSPASVGGVKYSVSMLGCFYQVPTVRQI